MIFFVVSLTVPCGIILAYRSYFFRYLSMRSTARSRLRSVIPRLAGTLAAPRGCAASGRSGCSLPAHGHQGPVTSCAVPSPPYVLGRQGPTIGRYPWSVEGG